MYTKQWLFVNGMKMKLPILRQRRLNAFLRGDHVLYNCGLVGGPRALFEPALSKVNHAYQSYWSLHLPRYLVPGADMLLWNDVALDMSESQLVEQGYPYGPSTLPMVGRFVRNDGGATGDSDRLCAGVLHLDVDSPTSGHTRRDVLANESAHVCNTSECQIRWARAAVSRYHFAHTLPRWWERLVLDHAHAEPIIAQSRCSNAAEIDE